MNLHPAGLGPLDPGARFTITDTTHDDCDECQRIALEVGDTFNKPENAGHWVNAGAILDFTQEVRRAPAYHSVAVRRERTQPWTPDTSPTGALLRLREVIAP